MSSLNQNAHGSSSQSDQWPGLYEIIGPESIEEDLECSQNENEDESENISENIMAQTLPQTPKGQKRHQEKRILIL